MGLVELLIGINEKLLERVGEVLPAENRYAFRLLEEARSKGASEATSKAMFTDATDNAHHIHVEESLNLGFFVFQDRSMLTFFGDNNDALASASFNRTSFVEIDNWLKERGVDMSSHW